MDRNREGRRASMAASNGISRRRHRSGSLRDSPDEDGGAESQEPMARLRDRGLKKDRDRDRVRSSRRKRRRGDREDGVDDTSDESVNEEDEYDDDMMTSAPSNHHQQHRKTFPPRIFRGAPALKPADEMIGVSVPRKARSASTKRLHDWISGGGAVGGDVIQRQESASPVSPSSSNASVRKKMMSNGAKPRPFKSSSLPSTSNPEEIEIEIAEVLYGLRAHSQSPCIKEIAPSDTSKLQNTSSAGAPLSAIAPRRKKPRQISENLGNFSSKMEIDQRLNAENSSFEESVVPEDKKVEVSALSESVPKIEEARDARFVLSTKIEVTSPKESPPIALLVAQDVTVTTVGKKVTDTESQKEEKFNIDLMAPPPQSRSSPDGENVVNFAAAGDSSLMEMSHKEGDKLSKIENVEEVNVGAAEEKAKEIVEKALDSHNAILNKETIIDLKLHQKPDGDNCTISQQEVPKLHPQPSKVSRDEHKEENPAQSSSFPLPMAVASWPGGLPPVGYMAPLQGLVSMEGSTMPSTPIPPLFSQPRGKRCATHYHIAQNIHYIQQLMKMNPFWPAAAGSPTLFGAKPPNFTVMPPAEFNGNITGRNISSLQDKGQSITIFPGYNEKDKTVIPTDQRKQQQQPSLLQQTAPTNILHGPAFIFPFNQPQQQQAAMARPGSAKSPTNPVNLTSSSVTTSGSTSAAPPSTTMSFNYPNISPSETQYLAILQNNGYPFPIGAPPPNFRGTHPQAVPLFNGSFYPSQMIHPPSQSQQQRSQGSSGNFQNLPAPKNRRENEAASEENNPSRVSMYGQNNFGMSVHPQSFALVTPNTGNHTEKKRGFKNGAESHPPQTFAVSFAPANGPSSVKSPAISGQSIAFSRSDLAGASAGGSATTAATDGSASRALNASSSSFNVSSLYQNQKPDQQQIIKLQQQQHQQQIAARNNRHSLPNGGSYPDHVKIQNVLGNFPQPYKQKNPKTTLNPQVPSSLSSSTTQSLKNHVQPQARRQQISFGSGQKPSVTSANAQSLNNTPSPSSVAVNSPTHSSVSKGGTGSPRSITGSNKTGQALTATSSAQTPKPSILGNPSLTATSSSSGTKLQQQQAQLFFPNHYMQSPQGPSTGSTVSGGSGYYLQRKQPEQQHQNPVSGTSDPAKAVVAAAAAAAAASAAKGQSSSIMHQLLPSGFSYGNTVPAGVQAKPADEQKQPAA